MNDISKTDFVPAEIEAQPPEGELESPAEKVLPTPQFESEKIFPLTAPVTRTVKGNPEVVTHVRLRAPIAMDVFEIGGSVSKTIWNPAGMIIEMDTERLKKFIQRLSGLDIITVSRIPGRDLKAMYDWLNAELSITGN